MMGMTRRYTGHRRAEPFFTIWPFEPPLVPLDARYGLQWLTRGHVMELPKEEPETITVTFPQHTNHILLRQLVSRWRREGAQPASPELIRQVMSRSPANPHFLDVDPENPAPENGGQQTDKD